MHCKQWADDTDSSSPSPANATNNGNNLSNREEFESDACAQGAFDKPRTGCTKIDDRPLRNRQGDAMSPDTIVWFEIEGLVHNAVTPVLPLPALYGHMDATRATLDQSPQMGSGVMRNARTIVHRESLCCKLLALGARSASVGVHRLCTSRQLPLLDPSQDHRV